MTPTLPKIYIFQKTTVINNYFGLMKTVQLFHPRASFESFAREKAREINPRLNPAFPRAAPPLLLPPLLGPLSGGLDIQFDRMRGGMAEKEAWDY